LADQELSRDEYFDLYKFFESRADTIKASMFESVTWVVGFAAAVLGFVVATFVDFSTDPVSVKHPMAAIISSCGGVILCVYALFLLYDAANHILRNWDRANTCAARVKGLPDLTLASEGRGGKLKVWHRMGFVVVLFLIAHLAAIVFWIAV
jgi:hypothetical protein